MSEEKTQIPVISGSREPKEDLILKRLEEAEALFLQSRSRIDPLEKLIVNRDLKSGALSLHMAYDSLLYQLKSYIKEYEKNSSPQ